MMGKIVDLHIAVFEHVFKKFLTKKEKIFCHAMFELEIDEIK